MCMQVFTIGFDLSLVLKIGIKNIFYKVACFSWRAHCGKIIKKGTKTATKLKFSDLIL